LRSPGEIWGRSSCANDVIAPPERQTSSTSTIARQPAVSRCKIFRNASRQETDRRAWTFNFDLLLGIGMKINDKAPDFTLPDENGKEVSLVDFRGKPVILFFFPRASTPGWTVEARGFRDSYKQIQKTGAVLLGISPDTPHAQRKFADKESLPFTLLADADRKVAVRYDVVKEKVMYGKKVKGIARTTFIIGADGKIEHIFEKVKPDGHSEEVLAYLKESAKTKP
jgi:thioredoxin-dependent peroxiredoxin